MREMSLRHPLTISEQRHEDETSPRRRDLRALARCGRRPGRPGFGPGPERHRDAGQRRGRGAGPSPLLLRLLLQLLPVLLLVLVLLLQSLRLLRLPLLARLPP